MSLGSSGDDRDSTDRTGSDPGTDARLRGGQRGGGFTAADREDTYALIRRTGRIKDSRGPPARPFERRYTPADIRLLAEVDAAFEQMSGAATCTACARPAPTATCAA